MRSDNDPDGAVHAGQLLDEDGVLDIAEAGAAELLRKNRAHISELAELADRLQRKLLRLVPLHHMRRDLRFRKFAHCVTKLNLFRRQFKIHVFLLPSISGPKNEKATWRSPRRWLFSISNLSQPQAGPVRIRPSVRRIMIRMASRHNSVAVLSNNP